MSNKYAAVEGQLVKFEEEFLKQKEFARLQKEADEKRYQEAVQNSRQERMKNLKTNHDYMKDWERNLTSLWKHSTVTMQELKDAKIRFNTGMTNSIKNAEDNRSTAARAEFENGIKNFEDNANRLGVELEHDSERTDKVEKAPFNFQAMMQKVKAKSELNEVSRKQKESRARYIALKQAKMREEATKQATIKSKLEKFMKFSELHKGDSAEAFVLQDKENFISAQRERQYLERKAKNTTHMEEIVKNLKTMSEEEYKKRNEEIKFLKQMHMFKEREKEYNQHYRVCAEAMDSMLRLMEACYDKLPKDSEGNPLQYGQINEETFKDLLKRFMNQEALEDMAPEQAELQSTILTYSKLKDNASSVNISASKENYLESSSTYQVPLTYGHLIRPRPPLHHRNPKLVSLMLEYIDMVYPVRPVQPFPPDSFNMLPLRLSILGDCFVGKKTIAKRLGAMLGIPVIDVDKLVEKAKSYVKHEEHEEGAEGDKKQGQKKPPTTKPGAGKKDVPVQLTETELEFQKYGVKFKNMELLGHKVTDDLKLDLINLELRTILNEKKLSEIKIAFSEAKHNSELKKQQKAAVAAKDDKKTDKNAVKPKQPAKDAHAGQHQEEVHEAPFEELYPYTQGYILLNYPSDAHSAK